MFLFLIPGREPSYHKFECMAAFHEANLFDTDSIAYQHAQMILSVGVDLHVAYYGDNASVPTLIDTYHQNIAGHVKKARENSDICYPGEYRILTKGFNAMGIQAILDHMEKTDSPARLFLKVPTPDNVKPSSMNQLE